VYYPHFVVVTDPAKRAAVAGFYKRAWDAYLSTCAVRSPASISRTPVHEAWVVAS
jgi:hypothetical protein